MDQKSRCPINRSLEILGDSWSLLIVRDMLIFGKKTFGEFLESEERIGTSVLTDRLLHLERQGILTKRQDQTDKRKIIYTLTADGVALIPVIYALANWGGRSRPDETRMPEVWVQAQKIDREELFSHWREAIKRGSSLIKGPDSVVRRLGFELSAGMLGGQSSQVAQPS